jgi:hypothetical protein
MSIQDDLDKQSKTIPQFCEIENMSASFFYKMKKLGYGPAVLHVPGTEFVRITPEAHAEWRARMLALNASKEAELERQRRVAQRRDAGLSAARKSRQRR